MGIKTYNVASSFGSRTRQGEFGSENKSFTESPLNCDKISSKYFELKPISKSSPLKSTDISSIAVPASGLVTDKVRLLSFKDNLTARPRSLDNVATLSTALVSILVFTDIVLSFWNGITR